MASDWAAPTSQIWFLHRTPVRGLPQACHPQANPGAGLEPHGTHPLGPVFETALFSLHWPGTATTSPSRLSLPRLD